jgi:guanine deaminase
MSRRAFRASILHFLRDPSELPHGRSSESYAYFEDGLLVVDNGAITDVGSYEEHAPKLGDAPLIDYRGRLIMPGFVDTHVHYPQTGMIGSYGEELLTWLSTYTYPTERAFADLDHARQVAQVFLGELLRNGTTSALVFATVHPASVQALFEGALALNMRLISGKVLMDRNAPDYLCDTPERAYGESKALIEQWHGRGRLGYAVTPRFAATSSPEQLRAAKRLLHEHPECWLHTHVAENKAECAWIAELYANECPDSSYLGVYDQFGLLTERAVFAHGVQLSDRDFELLAKRRSAISFCPSSNLFLGSGLFRFKRARELDVRLGLGTDIGAGTSFSQLRTLNEAYKVLKLQGDKLSALEAFHLATLGSAEALSIDDKVGSFREGNEADFVVLDLEATPLLRFRMQRARDLEERLFVLMTLGDDRAIEATYLAGERAHARAY